MLIVGEWITPQAKIDVGIDSVFCTGEFAGSPHALANFVTLKQLFRVLISFPKNNFIEFINNS